MLDAQVGWRGCGNPLEECGEVRPEGAALRKDGGRIEAFTAAATRLLEVDGRGLERCHPDALQAAAWLEHCIRLREQIPADILEHPVDPVGVELEGGYFGRRRRPRSPRRAA
jgi:hypothetical protein